MADFDLVVREAYLHDREGVFDVAVDGGLIRAVEGRVGGEGEREIDAGGDLVSPGLVDAHVHLDQALSAAGGRVPRYNDADFEKDRCIRWSADHVADATVEGLEAAASRAAAMAVANGVLHLRAHTYVDADSGAKAVEAVVGARDRLEGLADVQVVAFPQRGLLADPGSLEAAREALSTGADLVGGLDPASVNGAVEETIGAWFDLAEAFDADVDAHLHDPGTLGAYTLERLAERALDRGFEGRVTASHAFGLAGVARSEADPVTRAGGLDRTLSALADADVGLVTCYQSTPPGMPVRRAVEAGVTVAHGTDQVRDMWGAHGNADVVEGALVESLKLDAAKTYSTNEGLALLWSLITRGGADAMDLEGYGVEPGTPADLVVHDAASPQWAITTNATPRAVLKGGSVVARDGDLVGEASERFPTGSI